MNFGYQSAQILFTHSRFNILHKTIYRKEDMNENSGLICYHQFILQNGIVRLNFPQWI